MGQHTRIIVIRIPWVRDRWHIILAQLAESRVKKYHLELCNTTHNPSRLTTTQAKGEDLVGMIRK